MQSYERATFRLQINATQIWENLTIKLLVLSNFVEKHITLNIRNILHAKCLPANFARFSRILNPAQIKGGRNNWGFLCFTTEPNHLNLNKFNVNVTISPEHLAEDFRTLREHLSSFPGVENFLVGPDVTQRGNAMGYLKRWEVIIFHLGCMNHFSKNDAPILMLRKLSLSGIIVLIEYQESKGDWGSGKFG